MAKRLYLTNSAAGFTPSTIRGAWDATVGSPVTIGLKASKSGSYAEVSGTVTGSNPANYDTRFYNAVSDAIPNTGTLSGSVSWCAMTEDLNSADARYHVHIWVTQGDSNTLRGTLLSDYIGSENWSAIDNRQGVRVNSVPLSSVSVQAGDRIVVEMGIRDEDTQIFHTVGVQIGYGGTSSTDLANADTNTTHPGWFEFTDPNTVLTDTSAPPPDPDPVDGPEGRGGPLLPTEFGDDGKILVEVAWGADLADPDSWVWDDITCDVRTGRDELNIRVGRNDEFDTANAAECSFVVDNEDGSYSLGPHSPNYPNVRQNTPVRVRARVSAGASMTNLFLGYISELTPAWAGGDTSQPVVKVVASGIMRRLEQSRTREVQGAIRRYLGQETQVFLTDWWALDGEDGTVNGLNEIEFGTHAVTNIYTDPSTGDTKGDVRWGGDTDFPGTARSVSLTNRMKLTCPITAPRYDADGVWFFYFGFKYDADSACRVQMDSDSVVGTGFRFEFDTAGLLTVKYYTFVNSPATLFTYQLPAWDGVWNHFGIYYDQISTANCYLVVNGEIVDDAPVPGILTMRPGGLFFQSDGDSEIAVSNVAIFNHGTDREAEVAAIGRAYDAYIGESPTDRVNRICSEANIPVNVYGTSATAMGYQQIGTILDALRDCEVAEQGFLFDGISEGFTFISRGTRENPEPALTIDAREIAEGLTPTADDQRLLNKVIARRPGGGTSFYEDVDGPLGSAAIGLYDANLDVNCQSDASLLDYASWLVHLGTEEGYRYPELELNFRSTPDLAEDALNVIPSSAVRITKVAENLPGIPDEELLLIVEGYDITIPSPLEWTVSYNLSSAVPWSVAELAENRSDTGDNLFRLDTGGASLASSAAEGATSLSVATSSGPLWTTNADDFPLEVEILGIPVTVTSISGASSPQTFTVTGSTVTKDLASGSAVLYRPPVIAL